MPSYEVRSTTTAERASTLLKHVTHWRLGDGDLLYDCPCLSYAISTQSVEDDWGKRERVFVICLMDRLLRDRAGM